MTLTTLQRIAVFLFSLLLAVVLNSIPLNAADDVGFTLQSSTTEVRLAFAVSDRQGRVVKQLNASDVAVADNGTIIRQFRSFGPASENPLDLVILLDASDSLASQIPEEIAEVKDFVAQSPWGEHDRVSILAFGGLKPMLICARNCSAESAQVRLNTLRPSGATPLYDALLDAAEVLQGSRDLEARPAMILFSDGIDTISIHSQTDALSAAENLQAAIYCVNARAKKAGPGDGEARLDALASGTGGLSFPPGQDVTSILRSVLDDLHSGYVLTYDLPEQTSGQHSVRILATRDPRLQFRSRRMYDESPTQ